MSVSEHLKKHLELSAQTLTAFDRFAELLVETNKKFNLTALTDDRDMALLHFYDSLSVKPLLERYGAKRVVDIGCGAGFPSMPLAIAMPEPEFVMVDSTAKKLGFINEASAALGLGNTKTVVGRAESLAISPEHRESYDCVLARGVARLNVLVELTLPLVKPGGAFIAMKGSRAREELDESRRGIITLGGVVDTVVDVTIPELDRTHSLVVVRKISNTDKKYPRQYPRIIKSPL